MVRKKRMRVVNVERLQTIYDFIISYKRDHDGCAPSYREIGAILDVESPSLVAFYLKQLAELGMIEVEELTKREISIVGGKWIPPERPMVVKDEIIKIGAGAK